MSFFFFFGNEKRREKEIINSKQFRKTTRFVKRSVGISCVLQYFEGLFRETVQHHFFLHILFLCILGSQFFLGYRRKFSRSLSQVEVSITTVTIAHGPSIVHVLDQLPLQRHLRNRSVTHSLEHALGAQLRLRQISLGFQDVYMITPMVSPSSHPSLGHCQKKLSSYSYLC